jgi:uncharacterized protein YdaU (DUF1376 family)
MADFPYLPLFTDAYLADTDHLSLEEHGAYLRLLMLAWRTPGCALPNDHDWIARRLRISRDDFDRVAAPILLEFFTLRRGNRLHQKRLSKEFARARTRSEKQTARINARWTKEKAHTAVIPTTTTTTTTQEVVQGTTLLSEESGSRDPAAPSAGSALPPSQSQDLRDLDFVMSGFCRGYTPDDPSPWRQIAPGSWERVQTVQTEFNTLEQAYREQINWMCQYWVENFDGEVKASLVRKLINASGPERADQILTAADDADNRAAYVAAAIKNAKPNGKDQP